MHNNSAFHIQIVMQLKREMAKAYIAMGNPRTGLAEKEV